MPKSPLEVTVHREMTRWLVQRAITCPRTGVLLDMDTCVVLVDADGDPAAVVSQAGWAQIVKEGGDALLKSTAGIVADPTSVKEA